MITKEDFAALAAISYNNERGYRSETNKLAVPVSWTPLSETLTGFPAQPRFDRGTLGFTGGAYIQRGGRNRHRLQDRRRILRRAAIPRPGLLDGEGGHDYLEGGDKEDTLYGGEGNVPVLTMGTPNEDVLRGVGTVLAMNSIAAYARLAGVAGRFGNEKKPQHRKRQPTRCRPVRSNTQNAHTSSTWLIGQQRLGSAATTFQGREHA